MPDEPNLKDADLQAQGPTPRARWIQRIRSLAMDTSPLRVSKQFRLLWTGDAITRTGSRLTFVAIPYQIFQLTGSPLAVGLVGLCELIPILGLSMLGGAIADSFDRRKLLLINELALATLSAGLLLNATLDEPHLWVLYVVAFLGAAAYALGSPALRSSAPLLLPRDKLAQAAALSGASWNMSDIVGPMVAGVLIARIGLTGTFVIDILTSLVAATFFARLKPIPPHADAVRVSMASVKEGVRFLKGKPVLQGSFIVDIIAMTFGMPMALFPAIAERFGGPGVLGLLYAAPAAGALIATLTSGWISRIRRHGLAVYVAVVSWGASLIVFGMAGALGLALAALFFAGVSDEISAIFRSTILQSLTPAHMQGRLSGLELTVVASGPSLGDLEAGALAALTNVRFSLVFGGIGCIVGVAVMAVCMPAFHRYVAETGADPAEA